MHKLPKESAALIAALNVHVPPRCPCVHESEREIWMYAGQRALVDKLIALAQDSRVKLPPVDSLEEEQEEREGD